MELFRLRRKTGRVVFYAAAFGALLGAGSACGGGGAANTQAAPPHAGRVLIAMDQFEQPVFITRAGPNHRCPRIMVMPRSSIPAPEIAPNGRSVAYFAGAGRRGLYLLRVAPIGLGRPRTIDHLAGEPPNFTWSADSKSLVYAVGSSILLVRSDGSGRREIKPVTHKGAGYADPQLSPDRRHIAFVAIWGNGLAGTLAAELDVVDLRRRGVRIIYTDPNPYGFMPVVAWAPDSTALAHTAAPPEDDLYIVHSDGSHRRRVTQGLSTISRVLWAPNGKSLALTIARRGQVPDVYGVNRDGSGLRRLTVTHPEPPGIPHVGSQALAWSPTGEQLLLQRHDRFITMRPDGTEARSLCSLPSPDWYSGDVVWARSGR